MEVVKDQVKTVSNDTIILKGTEVFAANESLNSILSASTNISGKLHYALTKNIKYLMKTLQLINQERHDILQVFCKTDENQNVLRKEQGEFDFIEDGENKANNLFNEVLMKDYKIKVYKISLSDYENITIDSSKIKYDEMFFENYIQE